MRGLIGTFDVIFVAEMFILRSDRTRTSGIVVSDVLRRSRYMSYVTLTAGTQYDKFKAHAMSPSATPIKRRKAFFFFFTNFCQESLCVCQKFLQWWNFSCFHKKREMFDDHTCVCKCINRCWSRQFLRGKKEFSNRKNINLEIASCRKEFQQEITRSRCIGKKKIRTNETLPPEHTRIACKQAHTSRRFN